MTRRLGAVVPFVVGLALVAFAWTAYLTRLTPIAVVLDLAVVGMLAGLAGALLSGRAGLRRTREEPGGRRRGLAAVVALLGLAVVALWARDRVFTYTEEEIRFRSGDVELAGTLVTPRSAGPHPAVVMIHGSGPETRKEYVFYARLFARHGVAGLAYDKRGAGASGGRLYETDYSGYADDALAALASLRAHPTIDPDRIGLMGVSEGEWVAPLAAARSRDVAFVVVTGASGTSPAEQVSAEIAARLRTAGHADSTIQRALELNDAVFRVQRTGQGGDSVQAALAAVRDVDWFRHARQIPDQVYPFEDYGWWRSVMDFEPGPVWERVRVPVLVLKGALDPKSPADVMERNIAVALERGGNRNVSIVVLPDGDHALLRWPLGAGVPPPLFASGVLDTLTGWVERQVVPARGDGRAGQAIEPARRFVAALVERERLPGLAVTVSVGAAEAGVVWREGFGFADLEAGTPASPETRFRVGSVSKLLTAMVLVRLSRAGTVDLDDPMGGYADDLPVHLRDITLQQLAGHLGGIRHYAGREFLSNTGFETLRDAVTVFAADSLVAAPGTRYVYSSYGYNLIGAVLEGATGQSFDDLVQREVAAPLGMRATVPDVKGTEIPGRATPYFLSDSGAVAAPEDDLSGRWPSGGYLASSDDLARLGRAILGSTELDAASLDALLTPQRLASGESTSVGIGWRVGFDDAGRRYVHHGGSSNGGAAFLLVYPAEELVVALASNAFASWGEQDALGLAAIFLEAGS